MNRFLLRLLLPIVVILSILFWGGEFYLHSLPNDFKTKNQYLEDNAKDLKIMVLGASTISMGIKPSYFDMQPAYNFGYASQSNEYNLWILSKHFSEMDSLQYVILDMSLGAPWLYGDSLAEGRNKFYRLYYGYKDLPIEFEMMASLSELKHRIFPVDNKQALKTIDDDGYQSGFYEDVPYDELRWEKSALWSVDYFNNLAYGENANERYNGSVNCICKIIELCKRKNIRVVLVTPPMMELFYSKLKDKLVKDSYHVADSLANAYDNVIWLNFFNADSLFSVEEFYNPTHINPRGAKKFTMMLNDSINKNRAKTII